MKITNFNTLSKEFRKKMIDMDLSNKDLAIKVGVSASAISQFLTGHKNLSMARVFQICEILDFDLEANHKRN